MKQIFEMQFRISLVAGTFAIMLAGCSIFKSDTLQSSIYPDNESVSKSQNLQLIWSDEFDYRGLPDPTKWSYEVGKIRNNEMQYFTKARLENGRVEDGVLIIETRKEEYLGAQYTSASLTTKDKAEWIYGRIEIRAKLPTGTGMWPAIWMFGININEVGWPACGEIDIMENVGFTPDIIFANIHTKAYNHIKRNHKGGNILIPRPYDDFHIYAIEWFKDRIDFYADNINYFTYKNEDTGWETWPFNKKFYLIINSAFGGTWGGQYGVDQSILPQKFYIDYVRVYKASEENSSF